MPRRVLKIVDGEPHPLREDIALIQSDLDVSAHFPAEVEATARQAAGTPRLPVLDRTDLRFVTIDPPASMDLDQALHIERSGTGFVVHYAIADVAAFVSPGDPVDVEARHRGETLYGAGTILPLHPTVLSEGAASLLPDTLRPALLWTIRLDADGEGTDVQVQRALVRSTAKLSYATAQKAIDDGSADETLLLLREVGTLRQRREAARGGVSLPLPEQEVRVEDGTWSLGYRRPLPVEGWNAQISLLTGMAAASMMVYARVGLLRTLPPPAHRDVQRLHRTAKALGIPWRAEQLYPDFVRSLDAEQPLHAAMVMACTRLLRGSGYVAFDGETPEQPEHAALASEYAHVTAPLRRLGDRYAGEICLALCAGDEVPDWVLEQLHALPKLMEDADRRAHQYENAVLDLVEATVLQSQVGQLFPGVVVSVDDDDPTRGHLVVQEPAVEARVTSSSSLPLGERVDALLVEADPRSRTVRFEV
jgi:exoribonuclease R